MSLIDTVVQEHFEGKIMEDTLERALMFSEGLELEDSKMAFGNFIIEGLEDFVVLIELQSPVHICTSKNAHMVTLVCYVCITEC